MRIQYRPGYEEEREQVLFYRRSYEGGEAYREGGYLVRRELESEEHYERRCEHATYANYCAPVIDTYTDYLMGGNIHRDWGSLAGMPALESWLEDADGDGRSYHEVMTQVARTMMIEGWCAVVVDRPAMQARTRAEELALGIRPYLVVYSSLDVVDIRYVREGWQRVLDSVTLLEAPPEDAPPGSEAYRIWYRDRWELWLQRPGAEEAELLDEGTHPLGVVPVVIARNRDDIGRTGRSDLKDIAELNRRIYQIDADIDEVRAMTAFPFLAVPERTDDEGNIIVIGAGNALPYDPETPQAKPEYIEPAHTSISVMLQERQQVVEDIQRLSRLGGDIVGSYRQAESGYALELRFQSLNALLRPKGRVMERVENRVMDLFARWEGREWDGEIKYPDHYGIRDVTSYLDNAARALAIAPSQTLRRELGVRAATRLLGDVDAEVLRDVERELSRPRVQDMVHGGGQ